MNIKELLKDVEIMDILGPLEDIRIRGIASDSREVKKNFLFIAVRGASEDGHRYIDDAVRQGAGAVVLQDRAFMPAQPSSLPYILVADSQAAVDRIAAAFFGHPYQHIKAVGITGTNGKTTVSYLVRSILKTAGFACGLIGTIGYRIKAANAPLGNTTPGVIELHRLFKEMVKAKDRYVVMEVSSHALDQQRVRGIIFKASIFTNLTQDHLDYHKTMEEYFCAKEKLFKEHNDKDTDLIINRDDAFGQRLLAGLKGKTMTYGFSQESDVRVDRHELSGTGSRATIRTPIGALEIKTSLVGRHNLYNILASVAFGVSQAIDLAKIKKGVEAMALVPGRLERIDSKSGFSVFVDYAHTDDALKNVLESLRAILHNGRIITVFGCGGNRDREKRPKMGRVASSLSDYCFITSDNPRQEEPLGIIQDIVRGINKKNFEVEKDRRAAIQKALKIAREGDFILIAGKGHEIYQIVKDKVLPFDDRKVVRKVMAGLEKDV